MFLIIKSARNVAFQSPQSNAGKKAEANAMKNEKASLEQLSLIVRNLPKEQVFKLNFQQLEYLDF